MIATVNSLGPTLSGLEASLITEESLFNIFGFIVLCLAA